MDRYSIKKIIMVSMISILLLASGCGAQKDKQAITGSEKDRTVIVSSFYPVYIMTKNICKDIPDVKVVNMTRPTTGCLHDYQLTPDDVKTLEKAQFFVINGAGMESFMEEVIKQHPDLKTIEAARGISLLKGVEGDNPHVWVSVGLCMEEVKNITQQLSKLDPAHAAQYEKNSEAYLLALNTLQQQMHSELDGLENRNIVTFHEAFPYFAQEFNLNTVAVVEREPGSEPSPTELRDMIGIVKKTGVKTLFAEPQYSEKAAQTIARETGAKVYILDPAVTGPDENDAYIKIMKLNLKILKEALKS